MNLEIIDRNSEKHSIVDCDRYAFANEDTHSLPESLARKGGERLVIVNINLVATVTVT